MSELEEQFFDTALLDKKQADKRERMKEAYKYIKDNAPIKQYKVEGYLCVYMGLHNTTAENYVDELVMAGIVKRNQDTTLEINE